MPSRTIARAPRRDRRTQEARVAARVQADQVDRRELVRDEAATAALGPAPEHHALAVHEPDRPVAGRREGAEGGRVHLPDLARGMDLAAEDDHRAAAVRFRRRRHADRVAQVARPVAVGLVGRALRPVSTTGGASSGSTRSIR